MKHSLLYTTIRPHEVVGVIERWHRRSTVQVVEISGSRTPSTTQIEWIITTDPPFERAVLNEIKSVLALRPIDIKFEVQTVPPFCCNRGWNMAAKLATGDFLYLVPDDVDPPQNWDLEVESRFGSFMKTPVCPRVLHTDDGTKAQMLTHPIVNRAWYDRQGYLMPPVYQSMFDDTELGEVAYASGSVIKALDLKFDHRHWVYGKRAKDEAVDEPQNGSARMESSRRCFDWRKARGFPKITNEAPKSVDDLCAYLQVNKDDFCLQETCTALLAQGVEKFFFHFQLRSWSGKPSDSHDEEAVRNVALFLLCAGCEVVVEYCSVAPLFGEKRVDTETRVRNAALASMRARGWKFTLFVDGDELWRPGSVEKVLQVARGGWQAIAGSEVTVVGLPGYAVESINHPTIYIGPDAWFVWCRNPQIEPYVINERMIFHFTAVRRTFLEIVNKHRESGHYDDPEYHFEKWIQEILPKVKPGATNVHMYKDGILWPKVRKFTGAEWHDIPSGLRKYLGKP